MQRVRHPPARPICSQPHCGLSSAAAGILPIAACPCGFYAYSDGDICQPCPDLGLNSSCAGALEPPHARAGYFRLHGREQEWKSSRHYDPVETNVPPFVQCPVPLLCLDGDRCANGSTGILCTECDVSQNFRRGSDGACYQCLGNNRLRTVGLLSALGALIAMLWLLSASGLLLRMQVQLIDARNDRLDDAARTRRVNLALQSFSEGRAVSASVQKEIKERLLSDVEAAAGSSRASYIKRLRDRSARKLVAGIAAVPGAGVKIDIEDAASWCSQAISALDPDRVGLAQIIKIGLTFGQTLAAMANYVRKRASTDNSVNYANMVPSVLRSFTTFADLGFSSSDIQCLLPQAALDYSVKVWTFMLAPAVAPVAAGLAIYIVYMLGALVSCAAARGSASPTWWRDGSEAGLAAAAFASSWVLFTTIPSSISNLASAQSCANPEDGWFLFVEPSVSCAEDGFQKLQYYAKVTGWAYLALPVLIAWMLSYATRVDNSLRRKAARARLMSAASSKKLGVAGGPHAQAHVARAARAREDEDAAAAPAGRHARQRQQQQLPQRREQALEAEAAGHGLAVELADGGGHGAGVLGHEAARVADARAGAGALLDARDDAHLADGQHHRLLARAGGAALGGALRAARHDAVRRDLQLARGAAAGARARRGELAL